MTFLDGIESLQKKPRAVRLQVLIVSVSVIMAIVIGVWIINLQTTLHPQSDMAKNDALQPLAVLGDIIHNGFISVKDRITSIKSIEVQPQ